MMTLDMAVLYYVLAGAVFGGLVAVFLSFYLPRRRQVKVLRSLLQQNHFEFTIIDTRSKEEYSRAHIPGAIHLPLKDVGTVFPVENMFQPIFVYGKTALRAFKAARVMGNTGYFNVRSVGGFRVWKQSVQR